VLLALGVLISVALASGTRFGTHGEPGYATLVKHVPGWDALRTPGRLVLWTTLFLGVLAAGALTAARRRPVAGADADRTPRVEVPTATVEDGSGRRHRWSRLVGRLVRLAALVPIALAIVEGINVTPHPPVRPAPAALRGATGPLLVLPSGGTLELSVMLWSTDGFPRIVNGLASFTPATRARTRTVTATFPDARSVAYLRHLGVRTVVLLLEYAVGTPWQDVVSRPVDGLGVRREEVAGAVVFRIS
jgi:hypothetical protein